jgi:hypothetical protein
MRENVACDADNVTILICRREVSEKQKRRDPRLSIPQRICDVYALDSFTIRCGRKRGYNLCSFSQRERLQHHHPPLTTPVPAPMSTLKANIVRAYHVWEEAVRDKTIKDEKTKETFDRTHSWSFCLRVIHTLAAPIFDSQGNSDTCLKRVTETAVCSRASRCTTC